MSFTQLCLHVEGEYNKEYIWRDLYLKQISSFMWGRATALQGGDSDSPISIVPHLKLTSVLILKEPYSNMS